MGQSNSSATTVTVLKPSSTSPSLSAEGDDIYALFGLERYCEMTETNIKKLKAVKIKLLLKYHPDKNVLKSEQKEFFEKMTHKINLGYEILTSPELKRRHDLELRRLHNDEIDSTDKWIKWTLNAVLLTAGAAVIIAAATAAAPATLAIVGGSALLSAGFAGSFKTYADPDCSYLEYGKNLAIGAAAGAVGGGIAATAAPSVAAAAALGKVGISAGVGAASAASGHLIKDVVDLTINAAGGIDAIKDCRSADEILSLQNVGQLATNAAVGAMVGGVAQVVANGFTQSAAAITDDIANSVSQATSNSQQAGQKALQYAAEEGRKQVTKSLLKVFGEKFVENSAAQGTGLALKFAENTFKESAKGNSFSKALLFAANDTVINLPGAIISVTAGAALSTGIEHFGRLRVEREQNKLFDQQKTPMNANGTNGLNPDKIGDTIYSRDGSEHLNERHLGTRAAAMSRSKASGEAASMFTDHQIAMDAVKSIGEELSKAVPKAEVIAKARQNQQKITLPGGQKFIRQSNGNYLRKNVEFIKKIGTEVGYAARYDANSDHFLFAPCDTVVGYFDIEINPTTDHVTVNLITAYPKAPVLSVFNSAVPASSFVNDIIAHTVEVTNLANVMSIPVQASHVNSSKPPEKLKSLHHLEALTKKAS